MTAAIASPIAPTLDDASAGLRVQGGPVPWRPSDLARLLAGQWLGGVALITGWYGASGTTRYNDQLLWLVVGIGAIIFQGVSAAGWLVDGYRSVRARQRRLEAVLRWSSRVQIDASAQRVAAPNTISDLLLSGASMSRYHRPGCLLIAGKPVASGSAGEHADAGRTGCGVCAP